MSLVEFISNTLDPIGIVVGLMVAVPVFWTWIHLVFGEPAKKRRWQRDLLANPGSRPAVLVISLLPDKSIRAAVLQFCQQLPQLRDLPADRIITLEHTQPQRPDSLVDLRRELRRCNARLIDLGADHVHFFYGGPAILAAVAGAELSNGMPVLLYQKEQLGGYRCFGPLEEAF